MATQALNLWALVHGRPQIDPSDLAEAVCQQAGEDGPDYRTRLLIRDSIAALRSYWGDDQLERWLTRCPYRARVRVLCQEPFDEVGFPTIARRLMDKTRPDSVRQLLEQLGRIVHRETTIYVAGSVALILRGYLERHTDDIDLIDEVPPDLRKEHQRLDELEASYRLRLGHVPSHDFPSGWQQRAHSLGSFGRLRAFLLDVYDVFLRKLFSARQKDIDDLRMLAPQLDRAVLTRTLKDTAGGFLAAPRLLQLAQDNWQIVFGEPLPS